MRTINILGLISAVLISFVIGTILSYYLILKTNVSDNSTIYGSYISGIGSFLGGLFGGIFAYFIAKSQISNERKKEMQNQRIKNNNLIKALKIEMEHNSEILGLIIENDDLNIKRSYCKTLENHIWNEIKFEIISLFGTESYTQLNIHFKECTDLKAQILPKYSDLGSFNFSLRKKTIDKLISDLPIETTLINHQNSNPSTK